MRPGLRTRSSRHHAEISGGSRAWGHSGHLPGHFSAISAPVPRRLSSEERPFFLLGYRFEIEEGFRNSEPRAGNETDHRCLCSDPGLSLFREPLNCTAFYFTRLEGPLTLVRSRSVLLLAWMFCLGCHGSSAKVLPPDGATGQSGKDAVKVEPDGSANSTTGSGGIGGSITNTNAGGNTTAGLDGGAGLGLDADIIRIADAATDAPIDAPSGGTKTGGSMSASGGTTTAGRSGTGGVSGDRSDAGIDSTDGRVRGGDTNSGDSSGPVVTCSPVPRCPTKVVDADVSVDKDHPAADYVGVTEITGDLDVYTFVGISAFDCLEIVGGQLEFWGGWRDDKLLGSFPNLRRVGRSIFFNADGTIDSCAFRSLEDLGTGDFDMMGDVYGELNLGSLHQFFRIAVQGTHLRQLTLPSNGTFKAGQLRIQGNDELANIYGFENVLLTGSVSVGGDYSLYISNNPRLARCRAHDIAQVFVDAGYAPNMITVESSGICP
jgi:hypothetical protein